jgi:copper(I)-binding protein
MSIPRRTASVYLLGLAAALALVLAACSGSGGSQVRADGLILKDAWARASAMSSGAGAAYVTVENTTDRIEKLLSASVSSSVARAAEIHETTTVSGGPSSTSMPTGAPEMMSMREVSSIQIPAGATLRMEPGGYHIMLIDLAEPLVAGQEFTLNLGFMNAGVVSVPVKVRAS